MSNSTSSFSLTDGVLKFKEETKSLSTWVPGPVISTFTRQTRSLREWKERVACVVKKERKAKWNSKVLYAVTLEFRFDPESRSILPDVDNCIKPVLDGLAAGLFLKEEKNICDLPTFAAHHCVDDANFRILLIHRLANAETPEDEGVRLFVSTNGQVVENGGRQEQRSEAGD